MRKIFKRTAASLLILVLLMVMIIPVQAATTPLPYTAQGGRHDIELPAHANVFTLEVRLSHDTRIMFFDSSYREIGAGGWGPTGLWGTSLFWKEYKGHEIGCGPNVKYVAFFLDVSHELFVDRYL